MAGSTNRHHRETQMFNTKIRTTIAVLVATLAVGGAAVPAAQARPNDGRFQNSSEGLKQQRCDLLASLYASDKVAQHQGAKNGDWGAHDEYQQRARNDRAYAEKAGCAWAQ